jgi:uncharacterized protein YdeI (YjbR/CyaY-like superfamily)
VEYHASATEVWLGYYKKGVHKASVSYAEAVLEALCFGWIDGVGRSVDAELASNRFSPRTKRSNWSLINIERMHNLISVGMAHPAGIAAFEARRDDLTGVYSYENRPADLPAESLALLENSEAAFTFWRSQPPGYRRNATWWVVSAKREETRQRRLAELIADSEAGRRIKMLRDR